MITCPPDLMAAPSQQAGVWVQPVVDTLGPSGPFMAPASAHPTHTSCPLPCMQRWFLVSRRLTYGRLFEAYCDRMGISLGAVKFTRRGKRVFGADKLKGLRVSPCRHSIGLPPPPSPRSPQPLLQVHLLCQHSVPPCPGGRPVQDGALGPLRGYRWSTHLHGARCVRCCGHAAWRPLGLVKAWGHIAPAVLLPWSANHDWWHHSLVLHFPVPSMSIPSLPRFLAQS